MCERWQSRINRYSIRSIAIIFSLLVTNYSHYFIANAQQPNDQWMAQQQIPDLSILQRQLILVADQNRTVHAFNDQAVENQSVILYTQWSLTQSWNPPIDILLPPRGNNIRVMDAFLDETGLMHLIFVSGNELDAHLYYSNAPAVNAGNAHAWIKPELIGEAAQSPFNAALAGDAEGNLFVIYGGERDGNGIYALDSKDRGITWSMPEPIFFSYADDLLPFGSRLYLGESKQLHAVWNIMNQSGHGTSGHYASLDTGSMQWSTPSDLDEAVGLGIRTPSVIEHNNNVFVTYYNGNQNANWWRWSTNGGQSWSNPARVSPNHIGTNGHVSFAVDSQDTLHIFFGQRTGNQTHGLWHSTWRGDGWTNAEPIVSGPISSTPGAEFDPTFASTAVSQGNTILVTWTTDAQVRVYDVWYSYKVLNTPELPAVPLPVPTNTPLPPTPTLVPTNTPLPPTPTREPLVFEQNGTPAGMNTGRSPMNLIFLSTAPAALLSMLVIVLHRLRKRNHH